MMSKPSIRNFLFHRVSPKRDRLWDPMDVALFEKCIRYIVEHYEIIQAEDIPKLKENYRKHAYASITFDDGYKDNIIYALPILEKFKVKASFYVATECIEKNIPIWTHVLEHLFQNTAREKLNLEFEFLPAALRNKNLSTREKRIAFVKKLIPALKRIKNSERLLVMESIMYDFSDVILPTPMMSWNDLKMLSEKGHNIGSHTVSHSMLEKIESEAEILRELQDSGNAIRENIGYFPQVIAYPIGSYNTRIIELCKESGYTIGLATKQDVYYPERDNLFEIPRIELRNEKWWKTRMRITNLLESVKRKVYYPTHFFIGFGMLFFDWQ